MKKRIIALSLFLMLASAFAIVIWKTDVGRLLPTDVNETAAKKQQVVERGLDWVFKHPANLDEDKFLDVVEEVMLLYEVYLTLDDLQEKVAYRKYIQDRIQMIADKGYVHLNNPIEATGFLVLAEISDKLDIDAMDFDPIIKKEIQTNLLAYPPPPSTAFAIWNSLLLTRLGYEPLYPPKHLAERGVIAKLAREPELFDPSANDESSLNTSYDITHELLAFGAMGVNSLSLFGPEEIEYLKGIIPRAMATYIKERNTDILAELIVCSRMLSFSDFDEYQQAVDLILESQLPDGSFGEIDRMKKFKKHPRRHGVLTAIWALLP